MRFILILVVSTLFIACSDQSAEIRVENPRVRLPAPGQTTGAIYMTIKNRGPADTLLEARSDAAVKVEIHTTLNENGVMKMRRLEEISIAKKQTANLKSGGMHIMLFGMTTPVAADAIPVTLVFEHAGNIEVSVPIP